MTETTCDGPRLAVTAPPAGAPRGAALLTIAGLTVGLGPRAVLRLASVMRRRGTLSVGVDPARVLRVEPGGQDGIALTVLEHGAATARVTLVRRGHLGSRKLDRRALVER